MRKNHLRTASAVATALLAALSLTACQGDGTQARESTAPAASTPPSTPADGSAKDPATGTGSPTAAPDASGGTGKDTGKGGGTGGGRDDDKGTGGSGGGSSAGGSGGAPAASTACTGANTKVTYSPVARPLNHAILTVTNTGSTRCDAYFAPLLRWSADQQSPTAVTEASKPQAVVSVEPGGSAYAAVMLASADGSGSHGIKPSTLEVMFQPRSGEGSTGPSVTLRLPSGTYVDSSARVTYWQSSMDDALAF
ncbi:DUF4232 domain-containing protein [Streptomyces genisteinicus]|uniref:DUF4232 domain-containing protein n=1 Tax=Streptomyces genisteinicus TaxID=2768068 RepID=A0A7H0HVP9_9ACTN|nr:DUF4232 domain-containing protein [Streptomyces genisteinicus]QNP64615.1 DUF4232 domain-containing protein [Streptomyces genisteinicus]